MPIFTLVTTDSIRAKLTRTVTDSEAVSATKATLAIGYGIGDSPTWVTMNLVLDTSGSHGASVRWTSSNVSVIDDTGKVARPAVGSADVVVKLTAVITRGNVSDTGTFDVTVAAYRAPLQSPIHPVSPTHPDTSLWYNDGQDTLKIVWAKPNPSITGYYEVMNTSPAFTPTPSNAVFTAQESSVALTTSLSSGANYFHVTSVDLLSSVSTLDNVLRVRKNSAPPTVSSSSHPGQQTWYPNQNPSLAWTNPQADSNFSGYYYVLDHSMSTVPSTTSGTHLSRDQKQILLTGLANGIWAFHVVNVDTRNFPTRTAANYVLHIGLDPGMGSLSGTVTAGGAPVASATVTINHGLLGSTTTNSAGTFAFSNSVYAGTWTMTVSRTGYVSQDDTVTVTAGQATTCTITLLTQ